MCVVSMIGDEYSRKYTDPSYMQYNPNFLPDVVRRMSNSQTVTREEFEALRRDVFEMKQMLEAAKKYDERTGQPDCEIEDKVELLRKVAKLVGINLEDVL